MPRRTKPASKPQAPRRRRRLAGPYYQPGRDGSWCIAEHKGDIVTVYRHNTKEGVRRLAGLRPQEEL